VFERVESDPERVTVREMSHLLFFDPENLEGAERALRIRALSPGWRDSFVERLTRAGVIEDATRHRERGDLDDSGRRFSRQST
jgi:hypothetical protein